MSTQKSTVLAFEHQLNTQRLITLRHELEREIDGIKDKPPSAYIRIKREFNMSGSRKNVLRQLTDLLEERLSATSSIDAL